MLNRRQWCATAGQGIATAGIGAMLQSHAWGQAAGKNAYSLHIGVNRVDDSAYRGRISPLRGCLNDARKHKQIAESRGFGKSKLLTDEQATVKEVCRYIFHAADILKKDDIFFVSYAGHGTNVPDTSGDETDDGKDEAWCLRDGLLLDDYLYFLWSRFKPGVRLLVVSDSCHSGSVARVLYTGRSLSEELLTDEELGRSLGLEFDPQSLPRDLTEEDAYGGEMLRAREIPEDQAEVAFFASKEKTAIYRDQQARARDANSSSSVRAHGILLAACQDYESAWEVGSSTQQAGGVFTSLLQTTYDNPGDQDYQGLIASIGTRLRKQKPNFYPFGEDSIEFFAEKPFTV